MPGTQKGSPFAPAADGGVLDCVNRETLAALALCLTPGLGRRKIQRLIGHFGSAAAVLQVSRSSLREGGLSPPVVQALAGGEALAKAEAEARRADRAGVQILSSGDGDFPILLREIDDTPVTVYCQGDPGALQGPCVALVGSRRCSVYGRHVSRWFSRELSGLGLTIVSGLARGIDSVAHRSAVEAGGRTVAVLGTGVDVVYPVENRDLFERVRTSGCVLSEYPLGTYPARRNFPQRNRLISGLSYGTLIAEACESSGSLITARLSLEQNREVWAVPGNVTSRGSAGPNALIREGARPVLSPQDVLEDLPAEVLTLLRTCPGPALHASEAESNRGGPAEGAGREVLKLLVADRALHIDWIAAKSGLESGPLTALLLDLELKGLVRQWPGKRFSLSLTGGADQ